MAPSRATPRSRAPYWIAALLIAAGVASLALVATRKTPPAPAPQAEVAKPDAAVVALDPAPEQPAPPPEVPHAPIKKKAKPSSHSRAKHHKRAGTPDTNPLPP
jgi:hypothetical protein